MSLTTDIAAEKKDELSGWNANYQECSLIVGVGWLKWKVGKEMKSGAGTAEALSHEVSVKTF